MSAQYPGAAGTDANLFIAINGLSTLLSDNPLTSGATTVNVASTTGFPTAGYITIEAEAISYTGITSTSFTGCTRGADGTTAASHVTGLSVFHDVVAAHHNVLKDEIKAIETDLVASYTGGSTSIATTFVKYLKLIGGTMSGAITMGTNKITGLAAATAAGDALRYEQLFTTSPIALLGTLTAAGSGSNATVAYPLTLTANTKNLQLGTQSTTSITNSAVTIYTLNNDAALVLVMGSDSGGANVFLDVVLAGSGHSPTVLISYSASGSASARTYSSSGFTLKVLLASGTYSATALALDIARSS